ITDNYAGQEGSGLSHTGAWPVTVRNTIIAGNTGPGGDVGSVIVSQGHNLIGRTAGSSGWVASGRTVATANPRAAGVGPLQANGGATLTQAPLPGSPARIGGDPAFAAAVDQRGLPRLVAGSIDIGALQVQAGETTVAPAAPPAAGVAFAAGPVT